jgi:hypothetical protein
VNYKLEINKNQPKILSPLVPSLVFTILVLYYIRETIGYQSPTLPAIRTAEASAIRKELSTQLTSARETLNSSAIMGSAIAMD